MVHDRHIPLDGTSNMRDLGGLPLAGGRRMRRGRVYRAGALHELSDADRAKLAGLGIATSVDLRSEAERAHAPSRLPPGVAVLAPGDGGVGAQPGLRQLNPKTAADAIRMMQAGNRSYPERLAAAVAETFRAVVAAGEKAGPGGPASAVLFHCSAGKDRTGFFAAILLLSAGASRETVIEDYLATNLIWRRNSVFINQLPEAVREPVFAARADYIESALEEVDSRYGSVEAYLAGRCTIPADLLARYAGAIAE